MSTTLPHHTARGFRNPWPGGDLGNHHLRALLKWRMVDRLTKPLPPDPPPTTFPCAAPAFAAPRAPADRVSVTWVGHASFLLQVGGRNLLTDPMWSERASPVSFAGPRRWVPPGVPFDALPPIDVVVLSHNHYDHLDDRTVRRLAARAPDAAWVAPLGLGPFVRRRGARRVTELDWWHETQVDNLVLRCAPAQHFSARTPRDRNRTLWASWAIAAAGGGSNLFFGGDSGFHPAFPEIGRRFGPFDLILLPIGAYEPRWFMRPVHMNPEETVQAYLDLGGGGALVPMHWGTFKLTDEPMDEPPRRARAAWSAAHLPPAAYWQLQHGETRWLVKGDGGR